MPDIDRLSNDPEQEEHFSPESKVGLFVLAGLAMVMISILMLGDIHFRPQNYVHVVFRNIEGITDKSPIKVSGVEVGSVKSVELVDDHAQITMALQKNVRIYKNAKVRIRSTGIIGTKFIALEPGHPDPSIPLDDQIVKNGDTLQGTESLSLDELMERVASSLDQFTGGKIADNLSVTIANLRSITDTLNVAIGHQREQMVDIVRNIDGFTQHAKSVAAQLDDVLTSSKEEIKSAIHNLKATLDKTNALLDGVQQGRGVVGTLFEDPKASQDMKDTVSNLKQASESAKDVLSRFTKVRAFWIVQGRRDFKAGIDKGDVGLRLEPRPNKFYEIMGQNLSTKGSTKQSADSYERINTITGLIGENWGPFTGAVGVIESRAGVEVRYRPFQQTDLPVLNRLELLGQGFDFGRDAIINGRHFKNADYTAGGRYKINDYVTAGVEAEDIAETTNLNGVVTVNFEDKDIAYLLGFTSFAH